MSVRRFVFSFGHGWGVNGMYNVPHIELTFPSPFGVIHWFSSTFLYMSDFLVSDPFFSDPGVHSTLFLIFFLVSARGAMLLYKT